MALKIVEFNSAVLLELFLNGAVIGGRQLSSSEGKIHGLDTLTLIIGAETVTFSDADGSGYPLIGSTKSVKKAIEDATTGVDVSFVDGRLVLKKATGVTVKKEGTANPAFGFSQAKDNVGTVYAGPGGSAPMCHAISAHTDTYFALLEV